MRVFYNIAKPKLYIGTWNLSLPKEKNMPPRSKVTHYPTWNLTFDHYWYEIPDTSVRQQHLLDFFYECGVLDRGKDKQLNACALAKMQQDDVIAAPENLGTGKNIHLKKGFSRLRQCFLAETLYVNGVCKSKITKEYTKHSSIDEVEKKRWTSLQSLGGKCIEFACKYTPVSKVSQHVHHKKEKGRKLAKKIGSAGSDLLMTLSGRKRKRNRSDPMITIREMESDIDTQECHDSPRQGGIFPHLSKTPISLVAKKRQADEQESICSNPYSGALKRTRDELEPLLPRRELNYGVATKEFLHRPTAIAPSNVKRRQTDDQDVGYCDSNTREEDHAEDSVLPSTLSVQSPSNLHDQYPCSFACTPPMSKPNLMSPFFNSPFSSKVTGLSVGDHLNADSSDIISCGESPFMQQDRDISTAEYDEPMMEPENHPESNQGEQGVELTMKKYGLIWKSPAMEADERIDQRESIHNAKETLKFLHSVSKGDLPTAKATAEKLRERLEGTWIMEVSSKSELKKELADTQMISNIHDFFNSKPIKSRGKRDTISQLCMSAVVTAIISPENGFCDISSIGSAGKYPLFPTLEKCPVLQKSKNLNTFKIVLPFGILYCHTKTLNGYDNVESGITLYCLHKKVGINRETLKKCQVHRNNLYCGVNSLKMLTKQKKNWDNWDYKIASAVHKFGHDPEYVHPDNYSKQKYRCLNCDGEQCTHNGQRHNWMINGSIETQHEFFLDSPHFHLLYTTTLKNLHPEKEITKELVMKKASLKKFKRFRPNCIKPETRASCVDPIEAPAYDNARCLQLYFKGIRCTQQKLRSRYHQESQHQFYDPDDSDEDDIISYDGNDSEDDIQHIAQEEGKKEVRSLQLCFISRRLDCSKSDQLFQPVHSISNCNNVNARPAEMEEAGCRFLMRSRMQDLI